MLIPKEIEKEFIYSLILNDHKKLEAIISERKIDYERVLSVLTSNRIEYFVLNRIENNLKLNLLPINFLNELKKNYFKKSLPTLKIIEKVFLLSEKLMMANIEHVFLKGISLYNPKKIYMRPMRDIDILVNPEDISKVIDEVKSLNFNFVVGEIEISNDYLNNPLFYDLPPMADQNGVHLEIHFRIIAESRKCLLKDRLLESKKIIKVHNNDVCVPCNDSLFTHLVFHGSKKGNFDVGLSVIADLIQLFDEVDKNRVLRISESFDLKEISELFFEIIESSENKKLRVSKNAEKLKEVLMFPMLNSVITEILLQESFLKMLAKMKDTIFVSKDRLSREYGSSKSMFLNFYYIRRWIKQVKKYSHLISFTLRNIFLVVKRTRKIKDLIKN